MQCLLLHGFVAQDSWTMFDELGKIAEAPLDGLFGEAARHHPLQKPVRFALED